MAEDSQRPGPPLVVVKQLRPVQTDPQALEICRRLFNTEAEVPEKLGKHDQIPQLLAYFEQNNEFYLVQEYIEGIILSDELHSRPYTEAMQALTGRYPHQLLEDPMTPEVRWKEGANVSPHLAKVLDKMIDPNCNTRYQTASEVMQDLWKIPPTALRR